MEAGIISEGGGGEGGGDGGGMGAACGQAGTKQGLGGGEGGGDDIISRVEAARVEVMVAGWAPRVDSWWNDGGLRRQVEELVSRLGGGGEVEVMVAGWAPRVDKLVRTTEDLGGRRRRRGWR